MATENKQIVNDRTFFVEYNGKNIRMINGGRLNHRTPVINEHFLSTAAINTQGVFTQTETGAGGSKAIWAPSATVAGGAAVGVAGATTNNAEEIGGANAGWAPATMATNVSMSMEVRAKFVGATTAADGDFCIGFADALTYTSGLAYVVGLSSLYTTTAPVEFAGFHYSSIPTSGALFNSGGNNFVGIMTEKSSVAALAKATTVAKDSSFHIYRVELDVSANAAFYIDDVFVGSVAAATTAATALTPYVSVIGKNSHANTGTIDFIHVGGDLV